MDGQLTLGSLFDGIGGFPYAASFYGIRALWASEVAPECIRVTRRHFPDMGHVGDITGLDGGRLAPVDIITFGSPCQDLSVASGTRKGLAGERSGLFREAVRVIREMREATDGSHPRFALWENVPGAFSSAGGRDFKTVLEAFTGAGVPMPGSGRWVDAGMVRGGEADLAWCVYDAQYFGTAQRRRRIFLVADFGGTCAAEVLFAPKSLAGYFAAGGTPRQGAAAYAADGINENISFTLNTADRHVICMANGQRDAGTMEDQCLTLVTLHELPIIARMQSGGGCVRKAYVISAHSSNGMKSDNPHNGCYEAETSRTLDTNGGNPCCHQGGVVVVENGCRPEKAAAVDCRNLRETEETSGTLLAKGASGGYSLNYQNPVRIGPCVRRITPTEAERLQGYPDGWTRYGDDGGELSDTKRYRMLGNSVAVPCVAYIMQGIREAAGKPPAEREQQKNI